MPYALTKSDSNEIIDFGKKAKFENRYSYQIQFFCKTFCFKVIKLELEIINKYFLKDIVNIEKEKALLVSNIVFFVRFINFIQYPSKFYFLSIKHVVVLVTLYCSIYCNNGNYFIFLITLYMCFARAKVDTIILFNHLSLLYFYNIL